MRLFIVVLCSLLAYSCAAPESKTFSRYDGADVDIPEQKTLYIQAHLQQDVQFQGDFDYDDINLGGNGGIMYPGDTGALFLAAVVTHAVTVDSVKNNAKTKVQAKANSVLTPYQSYIQDFETEELLNSVIKGLDNNYAFNVALDGDSPDKNGFVLISEPVFYLTQDQRELILNHSMFVHPVGDSTNIIHKNIVEVLSVRTDHDDPQSFWLDENNLAVVSAKLYGQSIQLFVDDVLDRHDKENDQQKTFRYQQGGEKKYERGSLVNQQCGQTTIRTLRGWLKAFPEQQNSDQTVSHCDFTDYIDHEVLATLAEEG